MSSREQEPPHEPPGASSDPPSRRPSAGRSRTRSRRRGGKADPGEQPGGKIGRYVVVSRLGEGAMGMVYLAYDPKLDRRVALKVLRRRVRSSRATHERQQRLRREAQAMAQLNHANVVTVHDVGVAEGRVFLAMDYVEGQTLREWLEARRRPWNEVLRVFIGAARGLAAAHAAGVIHRDFKPENVLVTEDRTVKVMDFGLARPSERARSSSAVQTHEGDHASGPNERAPTAASQTVAQAHADELEQADAEGADEAEPPSEGADAERGDDGGRDWWKGDSGLLDIDGTVDLTRTGDVLGTPSYMAPELFESAEANASTDQFAFCVALYEGLCGVRPFAGESIAALAFNMNRSKFTPPPRGARVPLWLLRLVKRGLAVQPEHRYPSMQALIDALIQGAGRRRVRRAGGATVGLVALAVGLSYALVPTPEPCRAGGERMNRVWNAEQQATIARVFRATGAPYADEALARLTERLDEYAERWVATYTEVCEATAVHERQTPQQLDHRIGCLDERLAELDALVRVLGEADADANVARVAERAPQAASDLRDPEPCATEALATDAPIDPDRKAALAPLRARLLRADALEAAGRYADAATLSREIAAEAQLQDATELRVEALLQLGVAEDMGGQYEPAVEHLREAYFLANEATLDSLAVRAAVALVSAEGIHMARTEEGLSWARHAEAALQRSVSATEALRGQYHEAVGSLHFQRFELPQAREHYEKALTIEREALGEDHEQVASLLAYLGAVLEQSGESEDAVAAFEQAIEIHRRALGSQHPELAIVHNNYAVILFGRQDWAGAQVQLEKAAAIQREALGDHPATATSIDNLGGILMLQGQVAEGKALIEEGLAMRERILGPDHPAVANSLGNLGGAHEMAQDWGAARRAYERALTILEKSDGPDTPVAARMKLNLGALALREGAAQRGYDDCQRAVEIYEQGVGARHPELAEPLLCRGWAELELEQPQTALQTLERAYALRDVGQAEYPALVRLLLSRALTLTGGDAKRAATLRAEARQQYAKMPWDPPERVAAWLEDPAPGDGAPPSAQAP